MAPIINVSDEVLKHLNGLNVSYELVKTPKPADTQEQTTVDYEINLSDFIFLKGRSSGRDSYPNLLVCKYRLGTDNIVENAGKKLGLTIRNTAKEKNGRGYIGNINREQALKLNLFLGGRTLSTRIAKDFLVLLLSEEASDGTGKKINKSELSQITDEIIGVRAPYRAELFEDYFTGKENDLTLNKNYVLEKGVLVPKYSHDLTTCLMKNRLPGIDLKNWLQNATAQGFPKKSIKSGKLWYWHPTLNRAVRFNADPDNADLYCDRYPQFTYDRLGVRHVREARNFSNN